MFYVTPTEISLEKDLKTFVKIHGEPIPSTSPYAQFTVMMLAKEKVKVVLDGQGADEFLAGYHYFFGFYFKELLQNRNIKTLSKEIFHYLNQHRNLYGIKNFIFFLLNERLRTDLRISERGYLKKEFATRYKHSNSISKSLYGSINLTDAFISHFEHKLEHLLKWEDLNSMFFSIESRVPFLDYRLVERSLATSSELIIKNGMTKYILREAMKGIIPEPIRMRHDKVGFDTPQDEWFRTQQWQKIITEVLYSRSLQNRNIVDLDKVKSIYNKHLSKKVNAASEIWKIIHMELWYRQFID